MARSQLIRRAGLYFRLSKDDERAGESLSIENQRRILTEYARENGLTVYDEYVDDGYSGTDFDRPGVKRLLADAQTGKIDTIIVKDLSRFGRNYIQVGQYVDYIFPAYGIRFIALSDHVDTADRASTAMDMMPIMNVFNEWHAANTSKKIRAVFEASQRAGKYVSWNYPYGYRAGKDGKRTAVIDEEAAKVVRRIFDLRLKGNSIRAIARILTDDEIPNPATHYTRQDGGKWERDCSPFWVPRTVRWILSNPTYLGNTVQHKTMRVSYKNHRAVQVPESEWIVTENAHEPIVSREVWDKVQASFRLRGRADGAGEVHPLSGLVVCPDCGRKFKLRTAGGACSYVCRTYADLGKKYCPSHRISEKTLEEVLLSDLRALCKAAKLDEKGIREKLFRAGVGERERADEKKLKACRARLAELEKLICAAFEEKVLQRMPESVCAELLRNYQTEREELTRRAAKLEERLSQGGEGEKRNAGALERLSREMCLALVERIVVGQRRENGEREIHIYYRFR